MSYPQDVDGKKELEFATQSRRFLPFVVGGLGVLLIVAGMGVNLWKNGSGENLETSISTPSKSPEFVKGVQSVKYIKVDIGGAVLKPGLVEIPVNSRVQDVLITAGGLDPKADRSYIAKYINLAQQIADGMKIYIPFEGESVATDTNSLEVTGLYNLNTSTQGQLEELDGVGPATAKRIISDRPYSAIEDLTKKRIISISLYEKIKDKITIN